MPQRSFSVPLLLLAALAATSSAAPLPSPSSSRQNDAVVPSSIEQFKGREIDIGAGIIAGEPPSKSNPAEVTDSVLHARTADERRWDPLNLGGLLGGDEIDPEALNRRQWNPLSGGTSPKRRSQPAKTRDWNPLSEAVGGLLSGDKASRAIEQRQWDPIELGLGGALGGKIPTDIEARDLQERQWDFLGIAAGISDEDLESRSAKQRRWNPTQLGVPSSQLSQEEKRQADFLYLGADKPSSDFGSLGIGSAIGQS